MNAASRNVVGLMSVVAVSLAALTGCSSSPAPVDDEAGAVTVALTSVPDDVACLVIRAEGSRVVTRAFAVAGGAGPLALHGLPLGPVKFSASAFAVACAEVGPAQPTWTSDAVTATLVAGEVAQVNLTLRRPGRASVTIDFEAPCAPAELGGGPSCPGASCREILERRGSAVDGLYWIQSSQLGPRPLEVRCLMSVDGGGWTQVANYAPTDRGPAAMAGWAQPGGVGTNFADLASTFKMSDAQMNGLRTHGFRVHGTGSPCWDGPCTVEVTLYFRATCAYSSTARSEACSTAYLDPGFATRSLGSPTEACAWHFGLVDTTCGTISALITNHDPNSGALMCVGEIGGARHACDGRGDERSDLQIWVR